MAKARHTETHSLVNTLISRPEQRGSCLCICACRYWFTTCDQCSRIQQTEGLNQKEMILLFHPYQMRRWYQNRFAVNSARQRVLTSTHSHTRGTPLCAFAGWRWLYWSMWWVKTSYDIFWANRRIRSYIWRGRWCWLFRVFSFLFVSLYFSHSLRLYLRLRHHRGVCIFLFCYCCCWYSLRSRVIVAVFSARLQTDFAVGPNRMISRRRMNFRNSIAYDWQSISVPNIIAFIGGDQCASVTKIANQNR